MIASIRDLVRASLPKRPPSVAEAEERLEAERQAIAEATAAVQLAERRVAEVTLAAAAPAEVAAAHEALDAARATLRRRQDAEGVLGVLLDEMRQRDAERRREAAVRRADELMAERATVGAEIDRHVAELAQLLSRMRALNSEVMAAVPTRPADVPQCFEPLPLQNFVSLRLFAASDGAWLPRYPGLHSPSTAAELPTMQERLQLEREHLVSQYRPRRSEAA